MPDWKIHLLFGCVLAIFWFNIFYFGKFLAEPFKAVFLLLISLFSTTFADIDEKKSKMRSFISFVLAFSISVAYIFFYTKTWQYAPFYFFILFFIFRFIPSKHRGFTHSFKFSIFFSVILTLLFYFILNLSQSDVLLWFSIIFLNYNLHLFLDAL